MPQAATLQRIGTNVKVDIDSVRDRISSSLLQQLKNDPRGKVIDYKMTDGYGIGVILEFRDGTTNWFFNEEINRS